MMRSAHFPALFEDKGLDELFEGFFLPIRQKAMETDHMIPLMDISETDGAFLVKAEMPGIKKEDIDINVHDGMLTISGETTAETEEKREGVVIRQERRSGKYVRSMTVGTNIDGAHITANYTDGVLELTLPKLELEESRKIRVDVH